MPPDDGELKKEPGFWLANIWLLFLGFPLVSVLAADELSVSRKVIGVGLLALFALVHGLGYRPLARFEGGFGPLPTRAGWGRFVDPNGTWLWFALLVGILSLGAWIVGWPIVGAMPFIVTFAIFNFSWRTVAVVGFLSLVAGVGGPLLADEFGEVWYLAAIVTSVGVAAAFTRIADERQRDVAALRTELMLSEERTRVGRDVHDVLGHSLTAIVLKTQVAERALAAIAEPSPEVETAKAQLVETQRISRRALSEIRTTVNGLRSSGLGDELTAARSVLADAGVNLTVHGDSSTIPVQHHELMGWTVREAVTNIVRHADAAQCTIELGGSRRLLRVADDGRGRHDSAEGNGLTGLRERLAAQELDLRIDDENGTALSVVASGVPS